MSVKLTAFATEQCLVC